jgi:chromosome segregation ATPase
MPRTRNNNYERKRQKRTYIKKIQQSIDDLKIQIRQITISKIQELNMKISILESDLAHSKDNEKKLKERLEVLANKFNSFMLELFEIKSKFSLLNW